MLEVFIFTNAIFLGVLLSLRPSRIKHANLFLSLFLFSLSLELLPDILEEEGYFLETSFLTVPLLFLYVKQLASAKVRLGHYLLLIPALLSNVLVEILPPESPDILVEILVQIPFYTFNLYLLFSMNKSISEHQRSLEDRFANLESRTLNWVKGLVWIFLSFHLLWVAEDILRFIGLDSPALAFISELLTLLSVFWVGYHGLSQVDSTIKPENDSKTVKVPVITNEAHRKSFEEVQQKIELNKLYLNQELTLRTLAQQVDINEKKLSTWINEFTDSNFYHMINSYRIQEFKLQLSNPENRNLSLLGIAQNAGFRNKSTFYKVFKEFEGITPSEYKRSVLS